MTTAVNKLQTIEQNWLSLESIAEVEITSEDSAYPIENALLPNQGLGWRAATTGEQTIRLLFDEPQRLSRIKLKFEETVVERTQEYLLRWSLKGGSFQEIVRQQWNFSPSGSNVQIEDHQVDLKAIKVLEIVINPDVNGGTGHATLSQLQLA